MDAGDWRYVSRYGRLTKDFCTQNARSLDWNLLEQNPNLDFSIHHFFGDESEVREEAARLGIRFDYMVCRGEENENTKTERK